MTADKNEKAIYIIEQMQKSNVSIFDILEIISADLQCNMENCCISPEEARKNNDS